MDSVRYFELFDFLFYQKWHVFLKQHQQKIIQRQPKRQQQKILSAVA